MHRTPGPLRRLALAVAVAAAPGLLAAAPPAQRARADLLDVYQQAVANNADLAAARAGYQASKEAVPQARAGLSRCPLVSWPAPWSP